ncbi:SMP-30/gluconolactonase/LRE family protein [Cellulomonas sp. P5_C6]
MSTVEAVVATTERHVLAEGPVWDAAAGQVIWIDIERGSVFRGHLEGDTIEIVSRIDLDGRVGVAVPGVDGSLLVAQEKELVVISADGGRSRGPRLIAADVASRANDGACDAAGRLVIGTFADDVGSSAERLVRVEDDGSLTTIDDDLTLSNGLAWSPDGSVLYSTDTFAGVIWARDYDAAGGTVGPRREHLRISDGYPDGICVDARGYLWVAVWEGGEVRSFTPTGEPADVVRVPAPHVSSVAFVGRLLDRLLVTTASRDLDADALLQYPDAGKLFLADVGVSGTPTHPWSASWTTRSDD